VSLPVLAAGLATCVLVERLRLFGFGKPIPPEVRELLIVFEQREAAQRTARDRWHLIVQAIAAALLVIALGFHVAKVGLIGLLIIVLLAAFTGVSDEHALADALKGATPFTALLVVFFAIVAVIDAQNLFGPVIGWVLAHEQGPAQIAWLYLANGVLSAISDNVFVATVYINQLEHVFAAGDITREQLHLMAVAVNTGTNIPSVATPNGQAAFLFLLTSALAPLIQLSYARMVWMAVPYFVVMTTTGLLAVIYLLH
jgi:NhaB family Na+:H+ antiporter